MAEGDHVTVVELAPQVKRVILRHGFTETINVPSSIKRGVREGKLAAEEVVGLVYYISSEEVIPTREIPGMMIWREKVFAFMQRNAERPAAFYCIPAARVINVGTELAI